MDKLHIVIAFCIDLLNTKITITPYSFTILQYLLSCLALCIVGLGLKYAFLEL